MTHRPFPGRRSVLRGSLAASAALTLPTAAGAAPAFALSGRPEAGWGVQAGDVGCDSGLVWVRSDRPARMVVETSATESFRNPRRWRGPLLGADTDFTGTTRLRLPCPARRPRRPAPDRPAGHRHLPYGLRQAARRRAVRLVGRPGRTGLGHQP